MRNEIYKILHDLDYFLLRYGIEDVGKYTKDGSVVAKYYGVLMVYEKIKIQVRTKDNLVSKLPLSSQNVQNQQVKNTDNPFLILTSP